MSAPLTLRLRKVPTEVKGCPGRWDVVALDVNNKEYARWPWYYRSKPTRRNKYTMLNCYRYKIEWVE